MKRRDNIFFEIKFIQFYEYSNHETSQENTIICHESVSCTMMMHM